jgi:hypothetical protein
LVGCMKMRGIVVGVVESDHDTEEAAELWHGTIVEMPNARPLIAPLRTNPQPLGRADAVG